MLSHDWDVLLKISCFFFFLTFLSQIHEPLSEVYEMLPNDSKIILVN